MRKKRRRKVKGSKKGHRGKKETEDPLRTGTKMETKKNKKRTQDFNRKCSAWKHF